MNRILNVRFVTQLTRTTVNVICSRDLSYVRKFKITENPKCRFFVIPRNYCTTDGFPEEEGKEWMNDELFEEVTKGDKELEKRVKVLLMELESWKSDGVLLPKRMDEKHWKEYLVVGGYWKKRSYLQYLAKIEFKNASEKSKKQAKGIAYHTRLDEVNVPNHIQYQLGNNAMTMKINKPAINMLLNLKVLSADLFDNRIIFDMGYEKYMSRRQIKECAKQLLFTFAENRQGHNPYYFHFCNYPHDTLLDENVKNLFVDPEAFPISFHSEHYLDLFDKDRLIYLSPDSPYDLTYNPDDIYIIGAYVDTGVSLPISFAKAKADKIRTAKFPFDRHLKWKQGTKSLPLNLCVKILSDYVYYRDWPKAFKNVPTRRIDMYEEEDIKTLSSNYEPSFCGKMSNR